MSVREQLGRLAQRAAVADEPAALRRIVAETFRIEPDWDEEEDLDELRLEAFESLARLSERDSNAARDVLLDDLLPLCLRTGERWQSRVMAHRYDEILKEWLERFPARERFRIRQDVLTRLVAALDEPAAEKASRLIGMIGYRDEQATSHLFALAREGEDAVRDTALNVLAALGMPPSWHAELVRLWLERTGSTVWNHDLIGAAQRLASPEILVPVFDRWLTPENLRGPNVGGFLPQLAIAIPAAVAEAAPADGGLQDLVWDRLRALEPSAPQLFFQRVLGSSQVAPRCDSPGVVRYYLSSLAGDDRARDLAYFRLEECWRPRHLLGWREEPGPEVIRHIRRDAAAPAAMVGAFQTQELRRKLHAWQTLLSLGRGEALAGIGDAVAGERNGYAVGDILDIAACFSLDPLPQRVRDLIAGEFGSIAEGEAERLSSHVGAIAVARSAGSPPAMDALLGFNPILRKGGVLIALIEALSDTAAALIRGGDDGAAERLLQAAAIGQPEHRRTAAAAALGRLLGRGLLHPFPTDRLAALVEDESLDHYARREVLEGLGNLPTGDVPPGILHALRRQLAVPPAANDGSGSARGVDFRPAAFAALARLGALVTDSDELRRYPGLRREGATWRYDRREAIPGASVVIGTLYVREPSAFAPAVADLLRDGDWTAVVRLAPFLRFGPRPAATPVVDAILGRVRRAGPEIGEPELIPLLADLAPDRIASESWSGMFNWPPQVRTALAEALARHPSPDDLDRRTNLLSVLMGDGQYGVRRAAFRAMAGLSMERLHSICTGWTLLTEEKVHPSLRPHASDVRRRAAEAVAWLEPIPTEGPVAALAFDPEPGVRAAYTRCRRERQERDWARGYLREVLAVCDNASLLSAWKYGRALTRVGDDEVLERLEDRRRQELPPAVRHWLGRLIKELRTRWDEVTRNWPDPWFARRGRLERVDASVGDGDAEAEPLSCWLWQVPSTDLVEPSVWGGWCTERPLPAGEQSLHIPGRRSATIVVTQAVWGDGPTYFVGSGPYPDAGN